MKWTHRKRAKRREKDICGTCLVFELVSVQHVLRCNEIVFEILRFSSQCAILSLYIKQRRGQNRMTCACSSLHYTKNISFSYRFLPLSLQTAVAQHRAASSTCRPTQTAISTSGCSVTKDMTNIHTLSHTELQIK